MNFAFKILCCVYLLTAVFVIMAAGFDNREKLKSHNGYKKARHAFSSNKKRYLSRKNGRQDFLLREFSLKESKEAYVPVTPAQHEEISKIVSQKFHEGQDTTTPVNYLAQGDPDVTIDTPCPAQDPAEKLDSIMQEESKNLKQPESSQDAVTEIMHKKFHTNPPQKPLKDKLTTSHLDFINLPEKAFKTTTTEATTPECNAESNESAKNDNINDIMKSRKSSEIRNRSTKDEKFKCTEEGTFADEVSPNTFYICKKKRESDDNEFDQIRVLCPNGMTFNKSTMKCGKIDVIVKRTPHKRRVRHLGFKCKRQGIYPDPKSIRSYYVCHPGPKGGYKALRMFCPRNSVYIPNKTHCSSVR